MHAELENARDELRNKLLYHAKIVVNEILLIKTIDLVEIGLFGSLAKEKFTCDSDTDIYIVYQGEVPDRITKGKLRGLAEENNCDIVFIKEEELSYKTPSLLINEILQKRIILWRKQYDTE
jgi:predicted nucleotidyltransferase